MAKKKVVFICPQRANPIVKVAESPINHLRITYESPKNNLSFIVSFRMTLNKKMIDGEEKIDLSFPVTQIREKPKIFVYLKKKLYFCARILRIRL